MGNSLAELDTTALDRAAAPAAERPLPGLRAWFAAFVLWMVGLAVLALLMFQGYEQGDARAMGVWLLALMCFYLSLCNVFVPLPSAWISFTNLWGRSCEGGSPPPLPPKDSWARASERSWPGRPGRWR